MIDPLKDITLFRDRYGKTHSMPKYVTKHTGPKFFECIKNGVVYANTVRYFNKEENPESTDLMSDPTEARLNMSYEVEDGTQKLRMPGIDVEAESISIFRATVKNAHINDWAYCTSAGAYDRERHQKLVCGCQEQGYVGTPEYTHYVVYETSALIHGIRLAARHHPEYAVKNGESFIYPRWVTYQDEQSKHSKVSTEATQMKAQHEAYFRATSWKPKKFAVEEEFRFILRFKDPLTADWDAKPISLQSKTIADSVICWGMLEA